MTTRFAIDTNDKRTFYVYTPTIKAAREMASHHFVDGSYTIRKTDERDGAEYAKGNKL